MNEMLLLDSYLQIFINLSFYTYAKTHIDVLFAFILLLTLYSVTFCSTEIKAFDWLIDWRLFGQPQPDSGYICRMRLHLIDFNVMCIQYGQPAYVLSILVQVSSTYSYSQTIDNVLLITTIYAAGRFPDTTFSRQDFSPTERFPDIHLMN